MQSHVITILGSGLVRGSHGEVRDPDLGRTDEADPEPDKRACVRLGHGSPGHVPTTVTTTGTRATRDRP
jgi:hypothetical protein